MSRVPPCLAGDEGLAGARCAQQGGEALESSEAGKCQLPPEKLYQVEVFSQPHVAQ